MADKQRVLILGGGFAGLYAAIHPEKALGRQDDFEVILIDHDNFFLFAPMLHEVAASDLDLTNIVSPVRQLLKRVKFFQGDVGAVDLQTRRITVSHGFNHHAHDLGFDQLIIALGSTTNFFNLPGLSERGVEIRGSSKVTSVTDQGVQLSGGEFIRTNTVIWTAGTSPNALLEMLPCQRERGRVCVNEFLEVPGFPGVWALGDAALIPDSSAGKFCPPTVQHTLREGRIAAHNVLATMRGGRKKPFVFSGLSQLAAIGRRTGVAKIFGFKFSGFAAWWMWRTIYLSKLPRFEKKLRVALDWTLDLFFAKDMIQFAMVRVAAVEHRRRCHGTLKTESG